MSNTQVQITLCETCSSRKFSSQKGLICGLTNDKPDFVGECPSYEVDPIAKQRHERELLHREEMAQNKSTYGLSSIGIKNTLAAGIIVLVFGLSTIALTLYLFNGVSIWSVIPIVAGILGIVRGATEEKNKTQTKQKNTNTLDDELFG